MEETIAANQAIIDDLTLDDFAPHIYEVGDDGCSSTQSARVTVMSSQPAPTAPVEASRPS
ncbi:MAG: hypothetical protein Ct9H300mP30_0550 [Methanobacteriota archaeon]|nr:MAG: hypothetical protein Ct9H300mP30_0550 [Euryarchaeota archaeon]